MTELNVEHVLLFVIVAFLLYHLIGGCGCGGNGFRVGGQINPCNDNGLFNKDDGICECYPDYYGKSCEIYGVKCVDSDGGLKKLCGNDKKKGLVQCGKCIDKNEKILLENGCTVDDAEQWCNDEVLDNHTCDLGETYSKDGDGATPCLQCKSCNTGTTTNSSCTIYNNTDCSLNINANMNATCTQSNGSYFEKFNHCINQTDCVYSKGGGASNPPRCVNINTYNAIDGKSPFGGKNLYNISNTRYDICNNAENNYGSSTIFNSNDQKKACANIGNKYNDIRKGTCQYKKEFLDNKCTFLPN
jgi:hypothetical protein